MTIGRKSPVSGETDRGCGTADRDQDHTATPALRQVKWRRVLAAFLDRGPRGWNRFESARELRDHVLPTTVSQLERRGVRICRRDETLQGHYGPVTVSRYWIDPEARQRARALLGLPSTAERPRDAPNALQPAGAAL